MRPATAGGGRGQDLNLSQGGVMQDQVETIEGQKQSGAHAVFGAVVAVVGVFAAANPQSPLLKAINDAVPQLATAVPTLITACGAILAAFSQPPRLRR